MPVFAEHFSMVTTGGRIVTRAQVQQMFEGAAGNRPGLQMAVDELTTIWQGLTCGAALPRNAYLGGNEPCALFHGDSGSRSWRRAVACAARDSYCLILNLSPSQRWVQLCETAACGRRLQIGMLARHAQQVALAVGDDEHGPILGKVIGLEQQIHTGLQHGAAAPRAMRWAMSAAGR